MAIGDAAAAKGIPTIPGTRSINLGFSDLNAVADSLAGEMNTRAAADTAETTARIQTDTLLGQAIDALTAQIQNEANTRNSVDAILDGYAGQLFTRVAAAETAIAGKQPLHGYTPVAQTNNNFQIGLRFDGARVIARINDSFDIPLS